MSFYVYKHNFSSFLAEYTVVAAAASAASTNEWTFKLVPHFPGASKHTLLRNSFVFFTSFSHRSSSSSNKQQNGKFKPFGLLFSLKEGSSDRNEKGGCPPKELKCKSVGLI